jgi:predicted tellurium resistance membrane protein TerC
MALAFLLLIGISLIAEGVEQPIAKGYIYFAMGFPFLLSC